MAMRDFNFKQFLLEKGERVGLYAAGGVALLMIVLSLFLPGKGLFSASPTKSAKDISDAAQSTKGRLTSAAPSEAERAELRNVDPQLQKQATNVPQDPASFRLFAEMFAPRDVQSGKRRNPEVLVPDEFQVAVFAADVSNYMIVTNPKGETVYAVLRATNKTKFGGRLIDPLSKAGMFGGMKAGGTGGGGGSGAGMGGGGGMGIPGVPNGYNPMMRPPGGGGPGGEGGGPGVFGGAGGGQNLELKFVTKSELDNITDGVLARDMLPVRMAIVAGSFPFKAQVEEHRKALRLEQPVQVFNEGVVEKSPRDNKTEVTLPAFRFKGFNVLRRAFGPDGKLITSPGNPEGWQPLDFGPNSPYGNLAFQVGKEWAPEDPRIWQLLYPGLYMHRPVQIPHKQYPDVETKLPKVAETLKKLEDSGPKPVVPKNTKFEKGNFDPFGGEETGSEVPVAPESVGPAQEWSPPDYGVLRFLDVTLEPGRTYEYRIQVRMANPNFNKSDAEIAYPQLKVPTELTSPMVDVKGPDGKVLRVSVPEDLHYYTVDEQALKKSAREYKGMNANRPTPPGATVMQAQRWLGVYQQTRGTKTEFFPVGDWVVGQRMFVYRGESLGLRAHVHLPIWSPEHSSFILAGRPPRGPGISDRRPTEEVTFGAETGQAPLLVDFEGGPMTYRRAPPPPPKSDDGAPPPKPAAPVDVRVPAPTEVLLLSPDGKLLAHDGAADEMDPDRKEREESYTERVKEAAEGGKADGGKPGGPVGGGVNP